LPEHREIITMLHKRMDGMAPDAAKGLSYEIPAFKGKHMITVISPTKKDINFAFSRGAEC